MRLLAHVSETWTMQRILTSDEDELVRVLLEPLGERGEPSLHGVEPPTEEVTSTTVVDLNGEPVTVPLTALLNLDNVVGSS